MPVPLEVERDDVEDSLTEALAGMGEVTGAGWGDGRANLDVEFYEEVEDQQAEELVRSALRASGVRAARVRIDGGAWLQFSPG